MSSIRQINARGCSTAERIICEVVTYRRGDDHQISAVVCMTYLIERDFLVFTVEDIAHTIKVLFKLCLLLAHRNDGL